jgi:hypothetical protein
MTDDLQTVVLDIKPYVPWVDAVADATLVWDKR